MNFTPCFLDLLSIRQLNARLTSLPSPLIKLCHIQDVIEQPALFRHWISPPFSQTTFVDVDVEVAKHTGLLSGSSLV